MKVYKISLIILSMLILISCRSVMNYNTRGVKIDNAPSHVKKWINECDSEEEGIFLAKEKTKNELILYLYVKPSILKDGKYKTYRRIGISPKGREKLIIEVELHKQDKPIEKLIEISIQDRKAKYVILNNKSYSLEEIPLLSEE